MKSFLCRIVFVVFLFSMFAPVTGWGQTVRRKANPQSLGDQIDRQIKQTMEDEKGWRKLRKEMERDERQVVKKFLKTYPQGVAAIPDFEQQLHDAYEQYFQDLRSAHTEQQAKEANKSFEEKVDFFVLQADQCQKYIAEAEAKIKEARALYASYPGLLTPQAEKNIRSIYATYAQEIAAIPSSEKGKMQKLTGIAMERERALGKLFDDLEKKYVQTHPGLFEEE